MRVFGTPAGDGVAEPRRGVYAVVSDGEGRVAVVETARGYFLPGGGALPGETDEQTLRRECREELAREIRITAALGEAVQHYAIDGHQFDMHAVFFAAEFVGEPRGVGEYSLLWARASDADRFFHQSQAWAAGFLAPGAGAVRDDAVVPAHERGQVTLRPFAAADLLPVQRLIHLTIDASYAGVYPPRAVRYFKEFHSLDRIRERDEAGRVLVVERDREVVATGAVVGGEIQGVFVHPQSQKLGLGARLMDSLEASARAAGHAAVHLDVSLPSRGFYERRGYRLLESCSIDVGEGEHLDYWAAEKTLGARGDSRVSSSGGDHA